MSNKSRERWVALNLEAVMRLVALAAAARAWEAEQKEGGRA